MNASPFAKAQPEDKRLKCFLWGESSAGKTTLALSFPRPVVIDLERGTDLYADRFKFDRLRASTSDEVMQAVDWLRTHKHDFATLIIDPISVYWDALQRKWMEIFQRRRGDRAKGNKTDFYELQPTDWQLIKGELRTLVRKLTALDMNVICTAREKALYAEGEMMKRIGSTYDAEKGMSYLFDVEVRVLREGGKHLMEFRKVRGQPLPTRPVPAAYAEFEKLFGSERLSRETRDAEPVEDDTPATPAPEPRPKAAPARTEAQPPANVVTDKQLVKLWATAREKWGADANDRVRAMLADLGLGESTKTIPRERFEACCHYIESDGATTEEPPAVGVARQAGLLNDDPGYAESLANGGA